MSLVTPGEVKSFMEDAFKALVKAAPGFSTLTVRATGYSRDNGKCEVEFEAYNEHTGSSEEYDNPLAAIEEIRRKSVKRSASEMLREQAEQMLARADHLAAEGK